MDSPILAPAAVLILWSVIVCFWMVITRFAGFNKVGIDVSTAAPGIRYAEIESQMPASVNWKSHNYTHLMEQPTLFYAVIVVLALCGAGTGINLALAWAYTGIRIVHSLWQSLVNIVAVRALLFLLSTLCLAVLAVNAFRVTVL